MAQLVVGAVLVGECRRVAALRGLHQREVALHKQREENLLELGLVGVERAGHPVAQRAVALRVRGCGARRQQLLERRARLVGSSGVGLAAQILLQHLGGAREATSVQVLEHERV